MKTLILSIFLALLLSACKVTHTTWGGFATQTDAQGLRASYPMLMTMSQQGKKVKGTTLFFFADDPSVYVKMRYAGSVDGNTYSLKETKILDAASISGIWLTKDMELSLADSDDTPALSGTWKGNNASGEGGLALKQTKK